VAPDDLFHGLDLRPDDAADPHLMLSAATVATLAERARVLTGEPGLGVYLGLQMYSLEHGYLGFAAMSAPTLGEAVDLTVKYAAIRTTAFAFATLVEGSKASLVVEELADFGSARDIILLAMFFGLRHAAAATIGSESDSTVVELRLEEPWYWSRFRHFRPEVRFGCRKNALIFDASLLDAPLATANPASHRLAVEQCRQLFDSIRSRSTFGDRVRRVMLRVEGGVRSFDEVRTILGLASRTFRRRLADEQTTFSALRDEACRERALFLLDTRDLSLAELATHLGYANAANFTRAFQRWTGENPGGYRRSARSRLRGGSRTQETRRRSRGGGK
jgi:AraC-like DNA-binding protein